jgi:hypothetical protein
MHFSFLNGAGRRNSEAVWYVAYYLFILSMRFDVYSFEKGRALDSGIWFFASVMTAPDPRCCIVKCCPEAIIF